MKRTIKLAAEAFKPANLAKGLNAARNPPSQAEIDAALEHATPEQRAAYAEQVARAEAGAQQAYEHNTAREAQRRVLYGPAGVAVYGPEVDAEQSRENAVRRCASPASSWPPDQADRQVRCWDAPEVPQARAIRGERAQQAAHERAARDQARAPYRAPDRVPIHISRLSTRGKTQLDEVLGYLNASGLAPDRIFGVYRVPDRISQALTPHSEKGRPVEWDIVHSDPGGHVGAARRDRVRAPTSSGSRGGWGSRRCSTRSSRSRSASAPGSGPSSAPGSRACRSSARCAAAATRAPSPSARSCAASSPSTRGPAPTPTSACARPRRCTCTAPEGIHVEVLNWSAVAAAVHTRVTHPPPVPSPFPYLPATPQELLRAYLEVVGVRPEDSYSAQATRRPGPPAQRRAHQHSAPSSPARTARTRMRAHGCEHVVFVYRDRPEYAAGRARWAAYQEQQLQAAARARRPASAAGSRSGRARRPVRQASHAPPRRSSACTGTTGSRAPARTPTPYRYCWPPVR